MGAGSTRSGGFPFPVTIGHTFSPHSLGLPTPRQGSCLLLPGPPKNGQIQVALKEKHFHFIPDNLPH